MRNIVCAVLVVFILAGCSETINPGETGVVVNWGVTESWTYNEGFHWVDPFFDIHHMTLRTQTYEMGGGAAVEGRPAEPSVAVLTRDQLAVTMEVSVQFHLERTTAPEVFRLFGEDYANSLVHPIVRSSIRDAASTFDAIQLVDDRAALQTAMEERIDMRLHETLAGRGIPENAIVIENILLRNIDLPDSIEASIAAVQQQHQETARATEALETARAEAERSVVVAEAAARVRQIEADATAAANRTISASITRETLELRRIEAMDHIISNEHSRVVMLPAGAVPMFNMPTAE